MSSTAPTVARSETLSADLRQVLRNLKLSAISDTLPERIALATTSHMAYQDFLAMVLSDEVERRDRAGATSRARTARLDATMVLEAFDDTTESVFDRQLWSELTTLRFVDDVRDLCIAGPRSRSPAGYDGFEVEGHCRRGRTGRRGPIHTADPGVQLLNRLAYLGL